jgi:capsular polysaccharide biosynthesis protein
MEPSINNARNEYEEEIDLLELLGVLWQRIWLIGIGLVVGAAALFGYSRYMVVPQYTAESIIYIFSKTTSISQLADLQIGSQLTGDFTIIAKTREVIESVRDDLGLNSTYEVMNARISVTNPTSSHMLKISVQWEDPQVAASICNTLADELREQIADIMNTDRPSVVQRAIVPQKKSSPNTTRNTAIGALAGALVVAAFLIIRHLMDDTIKDDEDVRKYLNLNTLAMIPYVRNIDESNTKGKGGKHKHHSSSKEKGSSKK